MSDVEIELGAACMSSGHASDRATAPGYTDVAIMLHTLLEITRIVYVHVSHMRANLDSRFVGNEGKTHMFHIYLTPVCFIFYNTES